MFHVVAVMTDDAIGSSFSLLSISSDYPRTLKRKPDISKAIFSDRKMQTRASL